MVEEDKIKVHILGYNEEFIASVCSRINKLRPVEVCSFFDLKEFLTQSMEARPDMVAVSMSIRHPTIGQFPQIFANALNCPVIVFIEVDDVRSRSLLSACDSEFKINGLLTAHNLWMKIRHCLESQNQSESDKSHGGQDSSGLERDEGAIVLRGSKLEPDEELMKTTLGYLLKANQRDGSDGHSSEFSELTQKKKSGGQDRDNGSLADDVDASQFDQAQAEGLQGPNDSSNPNRSTKTGMDSEPEPGQGQAESHANLGRFNKDRSQQKADTESDQALDQSHSQEPSRKKDKKKNKTIQVKPKLAEKKKTKNKRTKKK
jgi:hypothetical protein